MSELQPDLNASAGHAPAEDPASLADHSLRDDVRALIDDGKTYVEAELQFQKSRVALVANRGRSGAIFAVGAVLLLHLTLITLAVGAVYALAPAIGRWGAVAVVVGLLLIGGIVLGVIAKRRFGALSMAFSGDPRR